ncbi:hypothetical protein IQ274_28340 [Nostoc sp. LEGE 12447]|nr:hypothetical protein [Nostoc sp. LEGE 12447]
MARSRQSGVALAGFLDLVGPTSNLSARKSHRLRERSGHEFVGSTRLLTGLLQKSHSILVIKPDLEIIFSTLLSA